MITSALTATTRTLLLLAVVCPTQAIADGPLEAETSAPHSERLVEVPNQPPAPAKRDDETARSPRTEVTRGLYTSRQVNVDFGQNNVVGDAANEPSLALSPLDPDHIMVGWRDFPNATSDYRVTGVGYTSDGGASWFAATNAPGQFRSDPVLDVTSDGLFFYQSLAVWKSCFNEPFETISGNGDADLTGWTILTTGATGAGWGHTADGTCGSGQVPAGNHSGGGGVGACIDADAAGAGITESYLCSPLIDYSLSNEPRLRFYYNYQVYGTPSAEDLFEVLVGTATPTVGNIGTYSSIFSTSTSAGVNGGAGLRADIGLPSPQQAHVCFHYRSEYDWYAMIDNVAIIQDFAQTACGSGNTPGFAWEVQMESSTNGLFFGEPVFEFGGDKNWMAIDRSGGAGHGNIYGAWNGNLGFEYDRRSATRSTDGGASFENPFEPGAGGAMPQGGVNLTVDADGALFAIGRDYDQDVMVVSRSTDAGTAAAGTAPTFSAATVDFGGLPRARCEDDPIACPNPDGSLGQPWIVTGSGEVYALSSVDPSGSDPLDVNFVRSTDGGATWSAPVRVNDDGVGNWQWFGTLSIAPNGRLDAAWLDSRNSGGVFTNAELFYSYSLDGGRTWSANVPASPVFDVTLGWPGTPPQKKMGDYFDMESTNAEAVLAYSATFNGEEDIYLVRLFPGAEYLFADGFETGSPDQWTSSVP